MARTVVVTGGTGGLGAAVTHALLVDDWNVVVPWFAEEELERVDAHERLTLVQADLTDPGSAANVAAAAGEDLRAVVNLVGGFAMGGRVHETPVEDFERQLRLNLRPTYLMTQAVLPHLQGAGGGSIVCTGAASALTPFAGGSGYTASKAAVIAFAKSVAEEGRPHGVRCNVILPTTIDTPANREAMPESEWGKLVPPARIAAVVAFLCSDRSSALNGAAIPV